jgi:Domain of unknown function (DUF4062)/inactive STAND
MARIYISSPFLDLQAERRAAFNAITRAEHLPIGMESYLPDERAPLDMCLADVAKCQAYIGIFAFRYGFVPDGKNASISELEYLEAQRLKIPVLIFLLQESANRPLTSVDPDRTRITAFRERLRTAHTVVQFSTPEELESKINTALVRRFGLGRPLPELLPYSANRKAQEIDLSKAVEASKNRARPLLCVLHGDEYQCPDMFLRRVEEQLLPNLLKVPADRRLLTYHLPFPKNFRSVADLHERLGITFSQEVVGSVVSIEEINNRLGQFGFPAAVQTHLLTDDWMKRGPADLLEGYVAFWRAWPDLAVGQRLFVFLSVKYRDPGHLSRWDYFRRRRLHQANEGMQAAIDALGARGAPDTVVLPRLECVSRSEVEDWARSDSAQQYCRRQDLMPEIRNFFRDAGPGAMEPCLPMERLAKRLTDTLYRYNSSIEGER